MRTPVVGTMLTFIVFLSSILLQVVRLGSRHLGEGRVHDTSGSLRLVDRTPNREEFVYLAVTEVRRFGGTSLEVTRDLYAMLENLTEVLPVERTPLLRDQLALSHRSTGRFFQDAEHQALPAISDLEGVGGNRSWACDSPEAVKPAVLGSRTN